MAIIEVGKIKRRVLWIEFLHWKKIGLRLLWRAILMNTRLWMKKWREWGQKRP
ncbi:MAG: hypothetical protein JSU88_07140 [Nitrospinaceae bacterium]|nr:MAG: hypothetical protein JSU88_07140 [Nitrospinaceae bacterium]